jgi:hypothetical protein
VIATLAEVDDGSDAVVSRVSAMALSRASGVVKWRYTVVGLFNCDTNLSH